MHTQPSSFGGSAMDRYIFDHETVEAAPLGGEAGGEAGAAPSPESAATPPGAPEGEAVTPAAATETAPAWTPESPEFRQAVAEMAGQEAERRFQQLLYEAQQEQQQTDQQTQGPPPVDPFSDDYSEQLAAREQWMIEQITGQMQQAIQPLLQSHQQQVSAEGQAGMKDILADLAAREGDFNQDAAFQVRDAFLRDAVDQYGPNMRAAEIGLANAAKFVRGLEQAAEQRGYEKGKNYAATLAGVPGEPAAGVSGATSGAQTLPEANSLSDVTKRYAQQAAAIRRGTA